MKNGGGEGLDFSLLAMGIVMTLAILALVVMMS
jgi:hypothetical protein